DLAGDEQLGLLLHRVAQVLVELRIQLGVGHDASELAQLEPARGEVVDERLRPRIAQHPLDLLLERRRIAQLAAYRRLPQFVVRHAAPEEERETRREIEIAQAIRGARRDAGGFTFDAEEEARRGENPLDAALNPLVEVLFV